MTAGSPETGVLLFAGKKLAEPIAWHGPIVMNSQQQIVETFQEMRAGEAPPKTAVLPELPAGIRLSAEELENFRSS